MTLPYSYKMEKKDRPKILKENECRKKEKVGEYRVKTKDIHFT